MPVNPTTVRWGVAGASALLTVGGLAFLFRGSMPEPATTTLASRPTSVRMARPTAADVVLKDEALIRDLRPLFLPTEYNAALPEPRREPGHTILDEEKPRLVFVENELGITRDLPPVATINGNAAEKARANDVLAADNVGVGAVGFGRSSREVERFAARGAFVEVSAAATGRQVFATSLPRSLGPTGSKAWEPMELYAVVDTAGLAAPLVVTDGSRVDEVDAHFRKVLSQTFRIGERLPPGFYRIVVGP